MVYSGKPSTGCQNCRQRRIKVCASRQYIKTFKADYCSVMRLDRTVGLVSGQVDLALGISTH